jgi:hypothetical protein
MLAIVISLLFLVETGLGQACQPALSIRLRAFQGGAGDELWLGPFANNITDRGGANYDWASPATYDFQFSLNQARDSAQLSVSQRQTARLNFASVDYTRSDLPSKIQAACSGTTRLRSFRVGLFVQSVVGQSATISLAALNATMDTNFFRLTSGDPFSWTSNNGVRATAPSVFLGVPEGHEEKPFTFDGTLSLSGQFDNSDDEASRVQIDACCALQLSTSPAMSTFPTSTNMPMASPTTTTSTANPTAPPTLTSLSIGETASETLSLTTTLTTSLPMTATVSLGDVPATTTSSGSISVSSIAGIAGGIGGVLCVASAASLIV